MTKEEIIFLELKEKGLRLTKGRKACMSVLLGSRTPLSVSQILDELERVGAKVDKTTVYRELERLEKIGIVHGMKLHDRKQYYELSSRDHHHHLVCVQCEKVEDVDINEKSIASEEVRASKEKRFTIMSHSLEFFGLCQKCTVN